MISPSEETAELRVAHVVLSLDIGGLERLVVDLIRQGGQLGQQVAVVCLERPGMLADEARAAGAKLYCVEKRPGLRPGIIAPLARLFGELKLNVVHTHQIGALLYAGAAARRAGVRAVIHTEHGKHYARRRTRWLGRVAGRYAQRFCCVSRDIAEAVRAARIVPAGIVEVVPNGIDVRRFAAEGPAACGSDTMQGEQFQIPAGDVALSRLRPFTPPTSSPLPPAPNPQPQDSGLTIGTIGRLNEIKRQELLLRAFARLAAKRSDLRLLLVGDGPMRDKLERLADELAIREQVDFAGYQAAPERYLRRMDIFALTSRCEGMPLSILEAWAAGVPVIASRVGGIPELVEDDVTGKLFTSGDDAELAMILETLCGNQQLRSRLSAAGLARVHRDFSVTRMAADYEAAYRSLLSAGRQPALARE